MLDVRRKIWVFESGTQKEDKKKKKKKCTRIYVSSFKTRDRSGRVVKRRMNPRV